MTILIFKNHEWNKEKLEKKLFRNYYILAVLTDYNIIIPENDRCP